MTKKWNETLQEPLKTVEQRERNTAKGKRSMAGHKWTRLKRIEFG